MNNLKEVMNLKENKLIFIGGRPATGKTAIVLDIAKDVALNDKIPVAVFSLETSIKKCVDIIIGDNQSLKHIGELSEANIFIDDTPAISVETIKEKCIKLKKEKNIGLIVIDYLQLIKANNNEDISISLKELSQKLDVPVIVTSQLTAEIDKREDKRPTIEDLKDSKTVADVSDIVMFLYKENDNREIIIAKNRQGDLKTIKV